MLTTTYTRTGSTAGFLEKRVVLPTRERARDRRGFYRSPVTLAEYRQGRPAPNKGRKFPPEPLTPREVIALIDACARGSAGTRNRALIALLWRTGLRVSEALALHPKDVDLDRGAVIVLHGKGDRSRVVGIDAVAEPFLRAWLEQRKTLGLSSREPLFCVISRPSVGRPMYAAYVRNLLKELAVKAGIERRVHPHGLRHTHAFELAGERVDLRVIKEQLGHSSLSTTARYIEHLNPAERIEVIRARGLSDADGDLPGAPPSAV
jgi:integrase/recombinase XerD